MKDRNLDKMLCNLARRPIPSAPANLSAAVRRAICARVHQSPEVCLKWLSSRIWQRDLALASIAAALVLGIGAGWVGQAHPGDRGLATSQALSLHVFSKSPPTLRLVTFGSNP
jgi:hypothetical protein